ncbi:MAG: selenium cofactor biosynthesis protein YqeC [Cellulosilyticaceae bacterium]
METLAECIGITPGITAFIGGGGKTTTIYHLADELRLLGKRVVITTTTKMYQPETNQVQEVLINPSAQEIKRALEQYGCIGVASGISDGKIQGVGDEQIDQLATQADYILVEADGAKHHPIKVPADHEPVIPTHAQHVVIVVGMKALGMTLERACFRFQRGCDILGVTGEHRLAPNDLGKLIGHADGLQKGIYNRCQTVLLNQMDVIDDREVMRQVARAIHAYCQVRIIGASLQQEDWVTEYIGQEEEVRC